MVSKNKDLLLNFSKVDIYISEKNYFVLITRDRNFFDQNVQVVAILNKKLKIFFKFNPSFS